MAYSYSDLTTDIRNYTEVDSNVFTAAIINGFIRNAEHRINLIQQQLLQARVCGYKDVIKLLYLNILDN